MLTCLDFFQGLDTALTNSWVPRRLSDARRVVPTALAFFAVGARPKPRSGEIFIEIARPKNILAPIGAKYSVAHKWAREKKKKPSVTINKHSVPTALKTTPRLLRFLPTLRHTVHKRS